MKKAMTFSIICSVLVLFAASSFAQPFAGKMRGRDLRHWSPTRIYIILKAKQKEFNITDTQLEKIKNLVFSFEENMIPKQSEISESRLELKKLMLDEQSQDYEKIRAILSRVSKTRQDIFIERLKVRNEIENILTPEQRDAIKEAVKERMRGRRFFQRGKGMQRFPRFRHWEDE